MKKLYAEGINWFFNGSVRFRDTTVGQLLLCLQLDGPWRGNSNDAGNYGAIPLPAGMGSISV